MRVTLRLTSFEIDPDTEAKSVIDIKEQDVYMGDMPLMTMNGTFIINGTERVIVSQMHRSPGVLFDHDRGKTHASGKYLFAARVIPYRGSWLDFEFDAKDIVNVRIDRKRKLPVTALLHALGLSSEEILNTFYQTVAYVRGPNGWQIPYVAEAWRGQKPTHDVVDADSGEVVFKAHEKITPRKANAAGKEGLKNLIIPTEEIYDHYSTYNLINNKKKKIALYPIQSNTYTAPPHDDVRPGPFLSSPGHGPKPRSGPHVWRGTPGAAPDIHLGPRAIARARSAGNIMATKAKRRADLGPHQPATPHPQDFRQYPRNQRDAEPDRGPARML